MRGWVTGLHRRHWEAIAGALGATAVMAKFSTVVSGIMHNPKLADMMQRAANGDANSVNAFTRALISGVDSGFNSPQPESQPPASAYRFQEFFKK
jgi:hypothetical protein